VDVGYWQTRSPRLKPNFQPAVERGEASAAHGLALDLKIGASNPDHYQRIPDFRLGPFSDFARFSDQ
jgi:hypothetical protein